MPLPGHDAMGDVSFNLDGLSFSLQDPPLNISGGFMRDGKDFYGDLNVGLEMFAFTALGGYSATDPAAFFIYAMVEAPLGGMPEFFVTGLAGGLGINKSLKLPTIKNLATYPLLPHNAPKPPEGGTAQDSLTQILPQLEYIFADEPGEYWIAAGILFTSFEMVNGFALVTVAFGNELEIGILGSANATIPQDDPAPLMYVEVDLVTDFKPAEGVFSVAAIISPASYLFGGTCRISGGFAFYIWFGDNPNAGEFIVTLGGYNSTFKAPSYYPTVPRLRIGYAVGPVQWGGEVYFALTPAEIMAGLEFYLTFKAGPIKAWLNAGVDFLLGWLPFHYYADAYVDIGVKADLGLFSISVHVHVDLDIWGPQFGGKAHVDLSVVSFTISFGASNQLTPPPVSWSAFQKKLIPKKSADSTQQAQPQTHQSFALQRPMGGMQLAAQPAPQAQATPPTVVNAQVVKGLAPAKYPGYDWIVDPNHFVIKTNSSIPSTEAYLSGTAISDVPSDYNKVAQPYLSYSVPNDNNIASIVPYSSGAVWNADLHIGPMQESNIITIHNITLQKIVEGDPPTNLDDFNLTPILSNSPQAMWGQYVNSSNKTPTSSSNQTIPKTLSGFYISPIPREPEQIKNILLEELIFQQDNCTSFKGTALAVQSKYTIAPSISSGNLTILLTPAISHPFATQENEVLAALANATAVEERSAVLGDLITAGFKTYAADDVHVSLLSNSYSLTDWPMVSALGDYAYAEAS